MWRVGTLFHPVHSHSPDQRASHSGCHVIVLNYPRNAVRLQQLFQAFREKDCIDAHPKKNALPGNTA
jgi:hypothetical protein